MEEKPLILIVDDTPKNVQILSNILYENGYNIMIATSGAQTFEVLKLQVPDLILLDIQMPGMDGYEVCRNLKSSKETGKIPVIFLTAVLDPEKIVQGFELGAVDYITKPFNLAELLARVATHIEITRTRKQLVELNATKDKFFNIIAHDLLDPFSASLTGVELLQRYIEHKDLGKIKASAGTVRMSLKAGIELLQNLLQWSRTQRELIQVDYKNLHLYKLVEETCRIFENIAENKKIHLINEVDQQVMVNADEGLLSTILRNLISNALKFSNEKGIVTVTSEMPETEVVIKVTDTGIGMSADFMNKLFRIEQNVSVPGTSGEGGTGLGLILCKEFVEKMGGKIWVLSEPGKGSTFGFKIPKTGSLVSS